MYSLLLKFFSVVALLTLGWAVTVEPSQLSFEHWAVLAQASEPQYLVGLLLGILFLLDWVFTGEALWRQPLSVSGVVGYFFSALGVLTLIWVLNTPPSQVSITNWTALWHTNESHVLVGMTAGFLCFMDVFCLFVFELLAFTVKVLAAGVWMTLRGGWVRAAEGFSLPVRGFCVPRMWPQRKERSKAESQIDFRLLP